MFANTTVSSHGSPDWSDSSLRFGTGSGLRRKNASSASRRSHSSPPTSSVRRGISSLPGRCHCDPPCLLVLKQKKLHSETLYRETCEDVQRTSPALYVCVLT